MKRLHVHVAVDDLDRSVGFYSTLFGSKPTVLKDDYAKWMLDDPHVNFAISHRRAAAGIDHIGIQVDESAELADISARLKQAGARTLEEADATCCYARSDKTWVNDPSGLRWETFRTFGEATVYGEDVGAAAANTQSRSPCCV